MKPLRTALTLCSSSYTKLQHTCGSKIFSQKRCKQIVLFQSAVVLCVLHAPKNSNIPSATGFFAKEIQAGCAFSECSHTLCTSCSEKFQYTIGDRFFSQKRCKQVGLFQSAVILCVLHAPKNSNIPSVTVFFAKEMKAGWAFSERSRTLCTSCSEKFQYTLGDRFFSRKRCKQVGLFQSAVVLCVLQALKKCKMRRISFAKKKETP